MTEIQKENKSLRKVPNLRFPGFEGEWEVKKLKDLGYFVGGGTPDTAIDSFWEGKIPWISSSDIAINNIHNIQKTRFITENAVKSSATKLIPKGAILMVSRVGIGKFAVADEDLCTSQDFTNLITTENEYFLCYYFNNRSNDFLSLSQGTSIKGFTTQDIKIAKFFIPSIKEQGKISTFLNLIDERIITQNKIIKQLQTLIKGVSKKLFSQKIRFIDFTEKWEMKTFGKIATFYSGGTPLTSKKDYFDGNIPFIRSGEINSDKTEQFISELGLKNSSAKIVEVGDILYALYGATSGEVGISRIKGAINQAVLCIRSTENHYFLYSYLVYKKESIIKTFLQGGQGNLSADIVKQLKINLPSLEEQRRIASFLSKIHQKIQTEEAILEQLNNQKQYLLKQLFV